MRYLLQEMPLLQRQFYQRLAEEGLVYATRCVKCDELHLPPRDRCPECGGCECKWVPLSGRGELYAFTQQSRALRFAVPAVIGIVKMEEGVTAFGVIDAVFDTLSIGDAVEAKVMRDDKGPPVLGFDPVGESGIDTD